MSEQASPTFALVHGSWHNNWCMSLLQQELAAQGFKSIASNLPISDPAKNFNDYAQVIADDLQAEDNVIGVFHSRAGNYGPRAVNLLNNTETGRKVVRKMIFLAGSFEDSTIQALNRPAKGERVPTRNTRASKQAIMARPDLGPDMTEFDKRQARRLFYDDVTDVYIVDQAIANLRPQNRTKNEPPMTSWPDIPQEFIICENDKIVRPEWSRYVCQNWLGIKPVYLPGSHSPFLAKPKELAHTIIELTQKIPTQRQSIPSGCKA